MIRTPWPIGPHTSLKQHRQALPSLIEAARRERARLDWQAHVPSNPSAADDDVARSIETLVEEDVVEAQIVVEDGYIVELPQARARRLRDDAEQLRQAMQRLAASGRTWPSAAEFATWSDERLNRQNDLAALDEELWPDGDPLAQDEIDEPHPLQNVMRDVRAKQREFRQAEANRVLMALSAWRAAEQFVLGTESAMVNGPFHRAVMMELAHDLQVAERTATTLVHTADDLDRRMPLSWNRFLGGEVPWRAMQVLHAELEGLEDEFSAAFDEAAAAALVKTAVPQLKAKLREIRERIQARTAVDRHEQALRRMSVGIEPAADGMAWLTALLPAAEAVFIDQRLDLAARAAASTDDEQRSIQQLRAHILLDVIDEGLFRGVGEDADGIAVPQRRGVTCKVGLLIPALTAMGHSDAPAVLQGYGPIDPETAKRLAGEATSWIKVLTDPVTGAVVDIGREKYRPTSDMRTLLGLLDRGGRGPGCTRPPSQTEMDHVEPFRQNLARGRTALDNLVLLARAHHRVKTSGLWDIQLQASRALMWTSFMGTRIITEVEPLPPTPFPEQFLSPPPPPVAGPSPDWADEGAVDDLDCPF